MTLLAQTTVVTPVLIPLNTPTQLGPWLVTVVQGTAGDEAQALLSEANAANPVMADLPGADANTQYVVASITVQNTSAVPRVINMADFAVTGSDGILRRPPAIEVPAPALQAIVPAGESLTGYVPFLVDTPDTATIWFDSAVLGGNWARGVFALGSAAALPTLDLGDTAASDEGNSPETAVEVGETVRSGGWEVTVTQWVQGQEVFDAADYRTQAWGSGDSVPLWRGLYATVKNLNPVPAVFPNDAFLLTDGAGDPWDNVLALTPPEPDLSRELLPGATREGWAAFDLFAYAPQLPEIVYVRLLTNSLLDDPRYIIVGDVGASTDTEAETTPAAEDSVTSEPLDVAVGETVVTVDEIANLRSEPSTSGDKLAELPIGTELEITGDPVEADGYRWYPVREVDGEAAGFVVQDYLEVVA